MSKQFLTLEQAYTKLGLSGGTKAFVKKKELVDSGKADTSKLTGYNDNQWVVDDDVVQKISKGAVLDIGFTPSVRGGVSLKDKIINPFNPREPWVLSMNFAIKQAPASGFGELVSIVNQDPKSWGLSLLYGQDGRLVIGICVGTNISNGTNMEVVTDNLSDPIMIEFGKTTVLDIFCYGTPNFPLIINHRVGSVTKPQIETTLRRIPIDYWYSDGSLNGFFDSNNPPGWVDYGFIQLLNT